MTEYSITCNKCDYRKTTSSYERAKELLYEHHIPTEHRPFIDEIEDD